MIQRRKWGDSAWQIGGDSARRNGVIRRAPYFPGVIRRGVRRITPLRRAESPLGNLARAESPQLRRAESPLGNLARAESPHCAAPNHPRSAAPNHPQKNGNKFFEISLYISKTSRSIQKSFGGLRTNIIHYSSAKYEVCSLKIRVARPKCAGIEKRVCEVVFELQNISLHMSTDRKNTVRKKTNIITDSYS